MYPKIILNNPSWVTIASLDRMRIPFDIHEDSDNPLAYVKFIHHTGEEENVHEYQALQKITELVTDNPGWVRRQTNFRGGECEIEADGYKSCKLEFSHGKTDPGVC